MAKLPNTPEDSQTVQAIYKSYEKRSQQRLPASIGASSVGKPCERAIWYDFRHCQFGQEFDGRMLRLFETGTLAEPRFIDNLRSIGCTVKVGDDPIMALGGHLSGKLDVRVLGLPEAPKTWHIVDFKTAGAKSFKAMKSKGIKEVKPEYYDQVMVYMHLKKFKRAMILVVNKDTDELYSERFEYDKVAAEKIVEKARRIVESANPPDKISDDPSYFICRYCSHKDLCQKNETPVTVPSTVSCRNCIHSTPKMDGKKKWVCEKHDKNLSYQDQIAACEDHLFIPELVSCAPVNSGTIDSCDFIEYEGCDKGTWMNSKRNDYEHFTSKQLNGTETIPNTSPGGD